MNDRNAPSTEQRGLLMYHFRGHLVKKKKLRKPRPQLIAREIGISINDYGTICMGPHYPDTLLALDAKEGRKLAAWLTKAADWAEQQQQEKTK